MTTWPKQLPNPSQSFRATVDPLVATTTMDSGRIRSRRRSTRARRTVTLSWDMTPEQFAIFQGYHADVLLAGTSQFRVPVPDGITYAVEVATFVGNYTYEYQNGGAYLVRATLELEPRNIYSQPSIRRFLGV